jgi:isoamylase
LSGRCRQLRARQRRNLLATLLLSEGVPLLLAGDEFGRTQGGNNNAYCQDNTTSWLDWSAAAGEGPSIEFVAALCRLRRTAPLLRAARFPTAEEVGWLRPDGRPMSVEDWTNPDACAVAVTVPGAVLLVNAWWEPLRFRLPNDLKWDVAVDTAAAAGTGDGRTASATIDLPARALVVLIPLP